MIELDLVSFTQAKDLKGCGYDNSSSIEEWKQMLKNKN